MKKVKRTTPNRSAESVDEAKLSEAVLELADPFFEQLGAFPSIHAIRNMLTLVVVAWNAWAMEKPIWGSPGAIDRARARFEDPHYPEGVRVLFDDILEERAELHGSDLRLVGEWSVDSNGAGGFTFNCESRLPGG